MTERWRRALGRLDREHPDEHALRTRAEAGTRMPEPSASTRSRVVAATVALLLAVGGTALAVRAIGSDGASPGTSSLDPIAVCGFTPRHGPEYVSLDDHEIPQSVLDEPGTSYADLAVGSPSVAWPEMSEVQDTIGDSRLPAGGWRVIDHGSDGAAIAAPVDHGRWFVVRIDTRDGARVGGWAPSQPVMPTAADRGTGLHLEWDGSLDIRNRHWERNLSLVNDRTTAWVDDRGEYWGIAHVFDQSTGAELDLGAGFIAGVGREYDLASGARVEVPVSLPQDVTSLPVGSYDIVACIPELSLVSPVGELRVLGDVTSAPSTTEPASDVSILVARPQNDSMAALGEGTLSVVHGCLALVAPSDPGSTVVHAPTFVIWPAGSLLAEHDGVTSVAGQDGVPITDVGSHIQLGGGLVDLAQAEQLVDGEIPPSCRASGERYFLAGEVVDADMSGPSVSPGFLEVAGPRSVMSIPDSWSGREIDGFNGRVTTQGVVVSSVPIPKPRGQEILPDLSGLPPGEVVLAILHTEGGAYQIPGPETPVPIQWKDFDAIPNDAGFSMTQAITIGGTNLNVLIGGAADGIPLHEADLRSIVASIRPA